MNSTSTIRIFASQRAVAPLFTCHRLLDGTSSSYCSWKESWKSKWHVAFQRNGPGWRFLASRTTMNITGGSSSSSNTTTTTNSKGRMGNEILMQHHVAPTDANAVVTTLTLNRPKANAMGSNMLRELRDCLDQLEASSLSTSRCVVVTSFSSKVFSAGADLKERATMSQDEASEYVTLLRNTMERVSRLPVPVIASVEGVAVGGGLEIALAADLIVASQTAQFGLPETSLAIIPGAGGTQRLPRLIGMARAKELIWTGRRVTAEEAYEYGLVQHVTQEGEALNKAMELSWKIAQHGPIAIKASKQAMLKGLETATMEEALNVERQYYQEVIPTTDRLEGLAAFKEGRTPQYKGE